MGGEERNGGNYHSTRRMKERGIAWLETRGDKFRGVIAPYLHFRQSQRDVLYHPRDMGDGGCIFFSGREKRSPRVFKEIDDSMVPSTYNYNKLGELKDLLTFENYAGWI